MMKSTIIYYHMIALTLATPMILHSVFFQYFTFVIKQKQKWSQIY